LTWVPLLNKSIKRQNLEKPFEKNILMQHREFGELKREIALALQEFQPEIGRGVGPDGPTDVIWIISFLFIIRTIGILGSKSTDNSERKRIKKNMPDC
jgi:hypothetical protein